ncbi:hypothetical protein [Aestuariibaculum marinum]|uniref:Uncharacterized protein n=1 Tax=Aestuariibaculum marinum TaxID=2683592 RepID=A0A8J6PWW8_9FLAO|nr:hypothetical protein [Aestuariibaculum marinum]MBD0822615.1 hypothetical protein [Aestuariibaculum marinum]
MTFTPEETSKIKAMLLYIIKQNEKQTGGHGGFHITDLNPLLEDLEKEGKIKLRRTIHNSKYFLNK